MPLSVVRMRIECPEGCDEAFMAKHFEGFGDVWRAIFGEEDSVLDYLPRITTEGHPEKEGIVGTEDSHMMLFRLPASKPMHLGLLLDEKPDSYEVVDYFPVLEGVENKLKIIKTHTWENGIEGTVAARTLTDFDIPISFFAPYFYRDREAFAENSMRNVCLAGVAFSCDKATDDGVRISHGPMYEEELEKFLTEHPDKTKEDFPSVFVSFQGCRVLVPKTYVPVFEYRCPVLDVKEISFLGHAVYVLHVPVSGDEDAVCCNLYVSEHSLDGYVPKAGDDIQGVLWMSGDLASDASTAAER